MASNTIPKAYVLVHGGWHGGWCWKRVADVLRSRGHNVTTPTQTGLGERSHLLSESITLSVFIDDIVNHLTWENLTSVVLVGHSFGGITITGVADAVPERIAKLIYLDGPSSRTAKHCLIYTQKRLLRHVYRPRRRLAAVLPWQPPLQRVSAFPIQTMWCSWKVG